MLYLIAKGQRRTNELPEAIMETARNTKLQLSEVPTGVSLYHLYSAKSVAAMLDMSERSVRDIDPALLPPVYTGPSGKSVRYHGINILMYMASLPPVDVVAVLQEARERFLAHASRPWLVSEEPVPDWEIKASYTYDECAEIWSVSKRTVEGWVSSKKVLRIFKGGPRVPHDEVMRVWLRGIGGNRKHH